MTVSGMALVKSDVKTKVLGLLDERFIVVDIVSKNEKPE